MAIKRIYEAVWATPQTREVGVEFFCDALSYNEDDIARVEALAIGETVDLSDPSGLHTVKRLPDAEAVTPAPTTADFAEGDRVIYVPGHANGDAKHPDCERGIVSSTNEVNVFVRYYNKRGDLAQGGQATSPADLIKAAS